MIGTVAGIGFVGAAGVTALAMRRRKPGSQPVANAMPVAADAPSAEPIAVGQMLAAPVLPAAMPMAPIAAAAAPTVHEDGRVLGRFEAAAEQGPTADNPFLTRRARVRRARFYDRRERLAAEQAGMAMPASPAPTVAPTPADAGQITYVFGKDKRPLWQGTLVLRKI